jgi:hypothetical protein
MKIIIGISFLISMLLMTSCERCNPNEYYSIDYSALTKRYFSCYKPGSYFIYLNQDSSKRDSFYITSYRDTTFKNIIQCFNYPQKSYYIISTYFWQSRSEPFFSVSEDKVGRSHNDDIYGGLTDNYDPTSRAFYLEVLPGASEFTIDQSPESIGAKVQKIESYKLWNNILPEVTLYTDSRYGDIYFAPNIGIAEFITNDKRDTFKIIKYYIP